MTDNYFEVLRSGINTTFQDEGRNNLYHIGIPFSGAMDYRNYLIANKLVGNDAGSAVIEFALQGPLLRYRGSQINIAISGDVNFELKKGKEKFQGNCYESYVLENNDEINILSTNKSVSVKNFINLVLKKLKIKGSWKGKGLKEVYIYNRQTIIEVDKKYFRPAEVNYLKGDFSKANKNLNWKPKTNLSKLADVMIDYEFDKIHKNLP